jgi:hypothetical protein
MACPGANFYFVFQCHGISSLYNPLTIFSFFSQCVEILFLKLSVTLFIPIVFISFSSLECQTFIKYGTSSRRRVTCL